MADLLSVIKTVSPTENGIQNNSQIYSHGLSSIEKNPYSNVAEDKLPNTLTSSKYAVVSRPAKTGFVETSQTLPVQSILVSSSSNKVRQSVCRQSSHTSSIFSTPRHIQPAPLQTSSQQSMLVVRPLLAANSLQCRSRSGSINTTGSSSSLCSTKTTVQLLPVLAAGSFGIARAPNMMLNMMVPQPAKGLTAHQGGYIMQPTMTAFLTSQSVISTPIVTLSSSMSTAGGGSISLSLTSSDKPMASIVGLQVTPNLHYENSLPFSSSNNFASSIKLAKNEQKAPLFLKTQVGRLSSSFRPLVSIAPAAPRFSSNSQTSQLPAPQISASQRLLLPPRLPRGVNTDPAPCNGEDMTLNLKSTGVGNAAAPHEKKKRGRPRKARDYDKHPRIEVDCEKYNALVFDSLFATSPVASVSTSSFDGEMGTKKCSFTTTERKIITHVLDDMLIYESNKPFPVNRSFVVTTEPLVLPKCSVTGGSYTSSPTNSQVVSPSRRNCALPESEALVMNSVGCVKCEFCKEYRPVELFKASRRFCSVSCARKYNVSRKIAKNRLRNNQLKTTVVTVAAESSSGHCDIVSASSSPLLKDMIMDNGVATAADLVRFEQDKFMSSPPSCYSECSDVTSFISVQSASVLQHSISRRFLATWNVAEVHAFVHDTPGCEQYAPLFRVHEIDGEALLLLKEDHLMQPPISMKLGPALKLSARIEENRALL